MKTLALAAALLLPVAAGTATSAQAPAAAAAIGPAVGARIATTATLLDQSGKPTTLGALAGKRGTMIVLFRSAKWCPYCQRQLKELGPLAVEARARGVGFAAISYDKPAELSAFAAKQGLAYPLYSDPNGAMFAKLGLTDPRYPKDNFAYGVPYPTTLLLDPAGRVKAKSVETDYKIRPTIADQTAMLKLL